MDDRITRMMVKKTQLEMVQDRGFKITASESWILNADVENKKYVKRFKQLEEDDGLNNYYIKGKEKLYVYYADAEELIEDMKLFVQGMSKATQGILIIDDNLIKSITKPMYTKKLSEIGLKPYQVFGIKELTFNLTKNIYSPKYEKIDKSTIIPSLANAKDLPRLYLNDPAVKYYGFPVGSVIRVTDELLAIETLLDVNVSYCIVVNQVKEFKY